MFAHNFKYSLKTLFKNKMLLFWTFIFPLVLGVFFKMAFSNIEKGEALQINNIAVVKNDNYDKRPILKNTLDYLSQDNLDKLFNITYLEKDQALRLLKEKEIIGYIEVIDDISIYVNESSGDTTVLKTIIDEVNMEEKIMADTIAKNDSMESVLNIMNRFQNNPVYLDNISNNNLSYTMVEYYTLIAMSAIYGSMIAMYITNYRLGNRSNVGKRTLVSGVKRTHVIISSLLASLVVQIVGLLILYLFLIFILKIDFGSKILGVIILSLFGSIAGLSLGVFVATVSKWHENSKIGLLVAITMLGSFFSGMMGISTKFVIDKNVPFINLINPVNMITDGLYAIYYYDSYERVIWNIGSLAIFSVILIVISVITLERGSYDSI